MAIMARCFARLTTVATVLALGVTACATKDTVEDPTTTRGSGEEEREDWGDTGKDEFGEGEAGEAGKDEAGEELDDVRDCFECFEQSDECSELLAACKDSLACTQLMDCPFDCGGSQDCVDECKSIIPTGVEPLTELVECMVCGGGPCVDECVNPWVQSYCP